MIGLLVALVILAIVLGVISQIPLPEPFSWVKLVIYGIAAIWFVIYAARVLGAPIPNLG